MPTIFHQNMRTFGGASVPRNNEYLDAFLNWGVLPPLDVAGFTEMNSPRTVDIVEVLASPALNVCAYRTAIFCGETPAAREYVIILSTLPVNGKGLVCRDTVTGEWRVAYHAPGDDLTVRENLAYGPGIDTRGIAFVRLNIRGQQVVAGFFHNTFTVQEPAVVSTAFSAIMRTLSTTFPGERLVIGGDFNVPAYDRTGRYGGTRSMTDPAYRAEFARDAAGNAIPTTAANAFDWYMVDPAFPAAATSLFLATRAPRASDHAGVLLNWAG